MELTEGFTTAEAYTYKNMPILKLATVGWAICLDTGDIVGL
jgi:hypothetical protein